MARIDGGGLAFISLGDVGVEVAWHVASGGVIVRRGSDPGGPMLVFTNDQWLALATAAVSGRWPPAYVTWAADGGVAFMTVPGDRSFLRFTAIEMAAFAESVVQGRFARASEPWPGDAGARDLEWPACSERPR